MGNPATLHPALVEVLQTDREALNARFTQRQRAGARIDGEAFQEHLRTTIHDVVALVAVKYAERVRAVVHALFDVSLDLFACGLLGPEMRHPHVNVAWRTLLPVATTLLARDPKTMTGCLSNAVDHIASYASARPGEWIAGMNEVTPLCESVSQWLLAGRILAWRAGLVQYRTAAFAAAKELPWTLAARCFGGLACVTEAEWNQYLQRMQTDRWLAPEAGTASETRLRIVRTTGGFRGFGNQCLRPPKVMASHDGLYVTDGVACWKLLADACGVLWHRVPKLPPKAAGASITIDAWGRVAWERDRHTFEELAEASSSACDGETLAVTLPTSHHVFLVARSAQ